MGHDLSQVLARGESQIVPFEEPFGSLARIDLAVFLECGVGSLNGCGNVFSRVSRTAGPWLVGAGVYAGKQLAAVEMGGFLYFVPRTSKRLPLFAATQDSPT